MNQLTALDGAIHIVLDGWTAPIVASYLGLVVIWYQNGTIHRTVLEFIRLTKKHTGRYLAEVVAQCLKQWKLDTKLLSLCMDNAANCSKLAEILPEFLPHFQGMEARSRCMAHIVNLIAQVFISFFFKKPKLRKSVKTTSRNGNKEVETEHVLEPGDLSDEGDEEYEAAVDEVLETGEQEDDGQIVHDEEVVKSIRDIAIQEMKVRGVFMTSGDEKEALKLFPAVSGLARRLNDNTQLKETFQNLVAANTKLTTDKTALARRVATRWNTDYDCLYTHMIFRKEIESMTGVSDYKLSAYHLSKNQWSLASDVLEVLELFQTITHLFSKAEVPLICQAIPMLYNLKQSLTAVTNDQVPDRDDSDDIFDEESQPTPPVIRIAAYAGVLLIEKYIDLLWDCDLYILAIVMAPDQKLVWFKSLQGITAERLRQIRALVINYWNQHYSSTDTPAAVEKPKSTRRSKWAVGEEKRAASKWPIDHIQTYLKDAVVDLVKIEAEGGYMKWWYSQAKQTPLLAQMGQDFCSAPASSVDAERAFSNGRHHVNFMQHNMASQTFKARMGLGAWSRTSLFPDDSILTQIIQDKMKKSTGKV